MTAENENRNKEIKGYIIFLAITAFLTGYFIFILWNQCEIPPGKSGKYFFILFFPLSLFLISSLHLFYWKLGYIKNEAGGLKADSYSYLSLLLFFILQIAHKDIVIWEEIFKLFYLISLLVRFYILISYLWSSLMGEGLNKRDEFLISASLGFCFGFLILPLIHLQPINLFKIIKYLIISLIFGGFCGEFWHFLKEFSHTKEEAILVWLCALFSFPWIAGFLENFGATLALFLIIFLSRRIFNSNLTSTEIILAVLLWVLCFFFLKIPIFVIAFPLISIWLWKKGLKLHFSFFISFFWILIMLLFEKLLSLTPYFQFKGIRPFLNDLLAIIFDGEVGIFFWSPVLIFSIPGIFLLWKHRKNEVLMALTIPLSFLFLKSLFYLHSPYTQTPFTWINFGIPVLLLFIPETLYRCRNKIFLFGAGISIYWTFINFLYFFIKGINLTEGPNPFQLIKTFFGDFNSQLDCIFPLFYQLPPTVFPNLWIWLGILIAYIGLTLYRAHKGKSELSPVEYYKNNFEFLVFSTVILIFVGISFLLLTSEIEKYVKLPFTAGTNSMSPPILIKTDDHRKITSILMESTLANSVNVIQEEEIARLKLYDPNGEKIKDFPIRAGMETAEWAIDRPDVKDIIHHKKARIFKTRYSTFEQTGRDFPHYTYLARFELNIPVQVDKIELTPSTDRAQLSIYSIVMKAEPIIKLKDKDRFLSLLEEPLVIDENNIEFQAQLPPATKIKSMIIVSSMANSTSIQQGTPIASIYFLDQGKKLTKTLKAGADTAEWAYDRADVYKNIQHKRANILINPYSFPTSSKNFSGHSFIIRLKFPLDIEFRNFIIRAESSLLEHRSQLVIKKILLIKP